MILLIPIGPETIEERKPIAVCCLLAANTLVFVLQEIIGLANPGAFEQLVNTLGYIPAEGNYYTLLTSIFLHADLFHLLSNMLFLWAFGAGLEDRMGHIEFLFLYFVSGICAGLLHGIMASGVAGYLPSIGASGAVFGVTGGFLALIPASRIRLYYVFAFFPFWFRAGITYQAAFWLIPIQFAAELLSARYGGGDISGVAHWAHVGGILAGLPFGLLERFWRGWVSQVTGKEGARDVSDGVTAVFRLKKKLVAALDSGGFEEAKARYLAIRSGFGCETLSEALLVRLAETALGNNEATFACQIYREAANDRRREYLSRAHLALRLGETQLDILRDSKQASLTLQKMAFRFPWFAEANRARELLERIHSSREIRS